MVAGIGAAKDCQSPVFPGEDLICHPKTQEGYWVLGVYPFRFSTVPLAAHDLRGPCIEQRGAIMKKKICVLRATHDDPPADGAWQGVDEEDQEDDEDDQDEGDDDVLLVVLPDEVVQALEGAHKPREGGVWAVGLGQGLGLLPGFPNRVFLGFFCCDQVEFSFNLARELFALCKRPPATHPLLLEYGDLVLLDCIFKLGQIAGFRGLGCPREAVKVHFQGAQEVI